MLEPKNGTGERAAPVGTELQGYPVITTRTARSQITTRAKVPSSEVSFLFRQRVQRLALLASKKQEYTAYHYRPHPSPNWDVNRLFFLYRQLDRAQFDLLGLLGITETAIYQPQDAAHDQHDCRNFDYVHFISYS